MSLTLNWFPTSDFIENGNARHVDADSADSLREADLSFFVDEGLGKLLRAMLKQSLIDIIEDRKNGHAPAEISLSARWLTSETGRSSIEFLMPGVAPDRVVARIYQQPEKILHALMKAETEQEKTEADKDKDQDQGEDKPAPERAYLLPDSTDQLDMTLIFDQDDGIQLSSDEVLPSDYERQSC